MTKAIVFDIDGTLSDPSQRLHHLEQDRPNWDAFYNSALDDKPIRGICQLAHMLYNLGQQTGQFEMIFCTGRPERIRQITHDWLAMFVMLPFIPKDIKIYMRKDGDHRPDTEVKAELYEQIKSDGYEVVAVFEDRKRVVDMWRAMDVPCLQVADGLY